MLFVTTGLVLCTERVAAVISAMVEYDYTYALMTAANDCGQYVEA